MGPGGHVWPACVLRGRERGGQGMVGSGCQRVCARGRGEKQRRKRDPGWAASSDGLDWWRLAQLGF